MIVLTIDYFPDEVLREIFSWLNCKQAMMRRIVCRRWCRLINYILDKKVYKYPMEALIMSNFRYLLKYQPSILRNGRNIKEFQLYARLTNNMHLRRKWGWGGNNKIITPPVEISIILRNKCGWLNVWKDNYTGESNAGYLLFGRDSTLERMIDLAFKSSDEQTFIDSLDFVVSDKQKINECTRISVTIQSCDYSHVEYEIKPCHLRDFILMFGSPIMEYIKNNITTNTRTTVVHAG